MRRAGSGAADNASLYFTSALRGVADTTLKSDLRVGGGGSSAPNAKPFSRNRLRLPATVTSCPALASARLRSSAVQRAGGAAPDKASLYFASALQCV